MPRNIFGWSLPPGVTQKMIDDEAGTNFCECDHPQDDGEGYCKTCSGVIPYADSTRHGSER